MLFYVAGAAIYHTNSVVFKMKRRGTSRGRRRMGQEVWFGKRNKRREGVTRLIKLLYHSISRIYKFNFYSSFNTLKTINLCT
jgi:hypothetical protein